METLCRYGQSPRIRENLYTGSRNRASTCWCKEKSSTVRRGSSGILSKFDAANERGIPRLLGHDKINDDIVEEFESLTKVIELNAFIVTVHP